MRKTVKKIIAVLMACLLIFGGSTMAFAADDTSSIAGKNLEEFGKQIFPSFKDFVSQNGIKGVFAYFPYIIFAAPIVYLGGLFVIIFTAGAAEGIRSIFDKQ